MKVGRAQVGPGHPLLLIAGPCVIEGEAQTVAAARKVAEVAQRQGLPAVFKCSFDKANRTSGKSFRGPGLTQGLRVLAMVKEETGLPVLTDVHEPAQCAKVAEVADVLQIPAFLCRQTDLLLAAAATGRPVNVKKGQFLAPTDMKNVVAKLWEAGCRDVLLTERGATFGYHDLVVDFRGLIAMRKFAPVCFDATHSVQQPGGEGDRTGGDRTLARALSDGPNSLTFPLWEETVADVQRIRTALIAR